MGRQLTRLSARTVATLCTPGYHSDGGGLYLQVAQSGAKSWIFRFTLNGRSREMGLGSLNTFTLAEARAKALECRKQLSAGTDPIAARSAALAKQRLDAAKALTFADCQSKYIEAHRASWRNEKHAAQWESTLKTYADPILGALPVQAIDVELVTRVLEPIWHTKPETAARVRGRIEAILDWATVRGQRVGDNPARWRGNLQKLLPARSKVKPVEHHPALPYAELSPFMTSLRAQEGVAARALEFTILTAGRTGEVIGAKPDEIDLVAKTWTIPAARMKGKREHRVPLSSAALSIAKAMRQLDKDHLFPGGRPRKPLSNMAMLELLKRMGRDDLTVHGFRSTFRDWAAERTNFQREVAEAALAHTTGDKVEAAYRRGDLFEKRRRLMDAWAQYCMSEKAAIGQVHPIGKKRAA